MKVLLAGLSHVTAPVEVRERLAISEARLPEALETVRREAGAEEALILSTCNRVEVAVTADSPGTAGSLCPVLAALGGVDAEWLRRYLYQYEDREAMRHIFRVAASLDSMVLGEPQILGQLKSAYSVARGNGALGGFLDTVLTRAFSVAKRVRSETAIGRSAVSISHAATDLARQIFGDLKGRGVLIAGAGKMSELAARRLHRSGCGRILVANRTHARAVEMAALFDGQAIEYQTLHDRLHEADIVLTSSGATHYLITKEQMRRVLERRRNRPVFLIDIAVPRNVDPAVNELEHAFLYDIDDLGRAVEENRRARLKEAEEAEQIIEDEVGRLLERLRARGAAPAIQSLRRQLEEWSRAELERHRARLGDLTPQQEEALQGYTRGLLNKIAHGPMAELRRAAGAQGGEQAIGLIRRIFRLEE
jgi:glutamyl-tRNA reductase